MYLESIVADECRHIWGLLFPSRVYCNRARPNEAGHSHTKTRARKAPNATTLQPPQRPTPPRPQPDALVSPQKRTTSTRDFKLWMPSHTINSPGRALLCSDMRTSPPVVESWQPAQLQATASRQAWEGCPKQPLQP